MAKRGERGNYISRRVILEGRPLHEEFDIPENFVVKFLPGDSSEPKLHICLFDHWTSNWKGGLLIHHAFVREVNDGKGKKKEKEEDENGASLGDTIGESSGGGGGGGGEIVGRS
ncbi:hypothetical protein LguiA_011074 [Lonicera macranthoides]